MFEWSIMKRLKPKKLISLKIWQLQNFEKDTAYLSTKRAYIQTGKC